MPSICIPFVGGKESHHSTCTRRTAIAEAVIVTASEFSFQHTYLIHIFCLYFVFYTQETGTPIQETTADVCDVKKEINWQNTSPAQCS